ncbi:MAG: hypothetical protein M3Q65_02125, partial [Chloroflexota bacterium]|nr:hypothetical protein [Chloroflexota bacterium]
PENRATPFSFLPVQARRAVIMRAMDEREVLRRRVRREQRLIEQLRMAAFRLAAAQPGRTWALVSA